MSDPKECKYCRTTANGDDEPCTSLAAAHECPWMSKSDWDALDSRAAPASEPVAWRWMASGQRYWALSNGPISHPTAQPLYAALPSSPAPFQGSLNSGESEPVVMPACGAGEAVSPVASPPVHEAICSDPWPPTNVVAVTQSTPAISPSGLAEVLQRMQAGISELKDREHYIPHHFHLACQALTHMAKGSR